MFTKARLKLTGWYLLIIMTISLSFSVFIYQNVTSEFQRRLLNIEHRLDLRSRGFALPPGQERFFINDLEQSRLKIIYVLLYTNGLIFVLSAVAGYFLAGKTLSPIEKAMEEQKRFVTDAGHELKTPLTALITTVEVALADKKLNLKSAQKALKESLEEAFNLNKLITNLLSLAHYQQNGAKLNLQPFKLSPIANSSIRKIRPQAQLKKIKIINKLEDIKITADPDLIEKLLVLLLDNAVKYTPKKGVVKISTKASKKDLIIKIQDNGIGISKKDLPHIFSRFYRADSSRTKKDSNSFGLGLSLAIDIVNLHSGTINVQSQPGKGSTFIIKLPLKQS